MDSDDEYEPPYDHVTSSFGSSELVAAYKDANRARQLIKDGHAVTANEVQAACFSGNVEMLEMCLSILPDPDARLREADATNAGVQDGWADTDWTPDVGEDEREWYPMVHAAFPRYYFRTSREHSFDVMNVLLRYGPDLYATYKQPLWQPFDFPFPRTLEEAENLDDSRPPEDICATPPMTSRFSHTYDHDRQPAPELGYGIRTVLHTILENGGIVKPIIDHQDVHIDPNTRDTQGRTLLHAVCRSVIGADANVELTIQEAHDINHAGLQVAPDSAQTSLFHTIRKLGADMNAKDFHGKNILHHLLEARSQVHLRTPLIFNTLHYILQNAPHLINEPDKHGTYPLHTSLQRLRGHEFDSRWYDRSPLEKATLDLLDAGADPHVRDSRGNTALHYLADWGVAEQYFGHGARALLRRFCEAGIDVNARNHRGFTALEILLDDSGVRGESRGRENATWNSSPPSQDEVDGEVFGLLNRAGAEWSAVNTCSETLLHIVAKHNTSKVGFRLKYLVEKGVDLGHEDEDGKTALDAAKESANAIAVAYLSGSESERSAGTCIARVNLECQLIDERSLKQLATQRGTGRCTTAELGEQTAPGT